MCGIAGIIFNEPQNELLGKKALAMSMALAHRGPDDEGIVLFDDSNSVCFKTPNSATFKNKSVPYIPEKEINYPSGYTAAFAHRRLSIIELSELGHQPMCTLDKKIWITYNGEIYNYLELKEALMKMGYTFLSSSDTEVLLKAYCCWGTACVDKLNGMWAFCIYDREKELFFASRDRLGVKPLYYSINKNFLAFASEQKAFIKSGLIKAAINKEALYRYLNEEVLEFNEKNFFEEIHELLPGQNFIYKRTEKSLKTWNYFIKEELNVNHNNNLSHTELIQKIKEKLFHAVEIRMRSDVEVGSCLSGGIDSSAIVGIMRSFHQKPIHAFTAVYRKGVTNEEPFAKLVAAKNNCIHHTVEPTASDFEKDFETLIYALDAPIWDSSTYSQFRVMKLASENNIKVVLDGQGADELFAGYHHHFLSLWKQISSEQGIIKALNACMQTKGIDRPLLFWLKQEIKSRLNTGNKYLSLKTEFKPITTGSFEKDLNKQLIKDLGYIRLKSFLRCEDRCSMWHGIESRTPFSDDIDLLKLMFSFNGTRKIQKGTGKYLLREACKSILPNEIYSRKDKIGFETPMNEWLGNMSEKIFSQLDQNDFPEVKLKMFKNEYRKNYLPHNKFLLKLFTLHTWNKVFKS